MGAPVVNDGRGRTSADRSWNGSAGDSAPHESRGGGYAVIGIWLTVVGIVVGAVINIVGIVLDEKSDGQAIGSTTEDPTSTASPSPTSSATPEERWWTAEEQVNYVFDVPERGVEGNIDECSVAVINFDVQYYEGWEYVFTTNGEADASGTPDLRWGYCGNEFLTVNPSMRLSWARGGPADADEPEECAGLAESGVDDDRVPWIVGDDPREWTVEEGDVFCLLTDGGRLVRVTFTGFHPETGDARPQVGLDLIAWELVESD